MPIAFIIMQIGNSDLDKVCETAMVPALKACGFEPKGVDKHNEGGLLKSEIINFIESSEIIVADLTNERPNCYLEVGYAMGVDKFRNLILTAREDHIADHPDRKPGGPKIHFDLAGYDVLVWKSDQLDAFRVELEKRVRRRQAILAPPPNSAAIGPSWDPNWFEKHSVEAGKGFAEFGKKGFMEIKFSLTNTKPDFNQRELLEAASKSVIRTSGWPIGVVMTKPEYRPRPTAEGIVAEIVPRDGGAYDYWSLRRNGDFYLLRDLFEDVKRPEQDLLFINSRIVQVTEAILYCARLYSQVASVAELQFAVRHGGLKGRTLAWLSLFGIELEEDYSTLENESVAEFTVPYSQIEARLVELVKEICIPLFTLFNFFRVEDAIYTNTVDSFVRGRAT
jgi:hypothetical protein